MISVLIPTYNRRESLKKTLLNIRRLEGFDALNCEVIVADNDSTDDTQKMVEGLTSELSGKLKYVLQTQRGRNQALNKALEGAIGDVIAITDDDVVLDPQWLRVIEENFRDAKVHCLTGRIIPVYDGPKPSWYSEKLSSVIGDMNLGQQRIVCEHATGANTVIRRSVLKTVGHFSVLPGLSNEDTVLSYKLLKKGFTIIYDPRLIVYHHFQPEKFTKPYFRRWYWLSGRTIAEVNREEEQQTAKKILGIPFWRYRWALEQLWGMIRHAGQESPRFYYELQLRRFSGFCYERCMAKTGVHHA